MLGKIPMIYMYTKKHAANQQSVCPMLPQTGPDVYSNWATILQRVPVTVPLQQCSTQHDCTPESPQQVEATDSWGMFNACEATSQTQQHHTHNSLFHPRGFAGCLTAVAALPTQNDPPACFLPLTTAELHCRVLHPPHCLEACNVGAEVCRQVG